MSEYALVIMAAGIGSRFGGLKQIEPVGPNGENTIEYALYDALQAGFGKVVFVINREIEEKFRQTVGKKIEEQCETIYVFQEIDDLPAGFFPPSNRTKPWGTAHAVFCCRKVIDSPFAVINADDYYGPSSYQSLLTHLKSVDGSVNQYCMVGYNIENTLTIHGHVSRGICEVDLDGFLININERTHIKRFTNLVKYTIDDGKSWNEIAHGSITSMNFWGFQTSIFSELEQSLSRFLENPIGDLEQAEYFLPSVIQELIKRNKATVKVLTTQEKWFGVTYQEDKLNAQREIRKLIQRRVYPSPLWRTQ